MLQLRVIFCQAECLVQVHMFNQVFIIKFSIIIKQFWGGDLVCAISLFKNFVQWMIDEATLPFAAERISWLSWDRITTETRNYVLTFPRVIKLRRYWKLFFSLNICNKSEGWRHLSVALRLMSIMTADMNKSMF